MRLGHTRSRGTLSFSPPTSPSAGSPSFTAPWGTSPPGTPALSFSSPPVSPCTTRFSRRTGSIESSLNLGLTTTPPSEDGEYEYGREIADSFTSFAPFAPFPVEDADRLAAGPASQSRWSLGSSLAHNDDDDVPAPLLSEKDQPNTRRRLKSLISLLSPHPSPVSEDTDRDASPAKDSPKIKHKGSLASLGYHRRSHMLPPRSVSPAPPTPSLTTTFALPSIAQSPCTPSFPAQQLQAPAPPPAPMPTAALPPSPPKKTTLLETLGLKRPKTPKSSKPKPTRAAGPKRILVLKAPEAARPALLAWCQAFGEVTAFTPLPAHAHSHCAPRASEDGVLVVQAQEMETEVHVEFACAKVAETVCRVRGEVSVAGWNVGMGWF